MMVDSFWMSRSLCTIQGSRIAQAGTNPSTTLHPLMVGQCLERREVGGKMARPIHMKDYNHYHPHHELPYEIKLANLGGTAS